MFETQKQKHWSSFAASKTEPEKKKKNLRELTIEHTMTGSLSVQLGRDWSGALTMLAITLGGTLGSVPSMKNSKQLARVRDKSGDVRLLPIINVDYMAKIRAMDMLFHQAIENETLPVSFGTEKLWMTVLCGKRRNAFDLDNVFTTLQDWLEPSTKATGARKKQRGWGVGVVENDSQIRGIALKGEDVNATGTETLIVCRRFEEVLPRLNFISAEL